MNSLTILDFNYNDQPLPYVLDEAKEPWFNANAVCTILGYANSRQAVARHVDEDDVCQRDTIDSMGRTQLANHVNEVGLYSLVFGSELASAKVFKRWVCKEVLPAIRKTGTYTVPRRMRLGHEQIMALLKPMIKSFWKLKTPESIFAALALIEDAERQMQISFGTVKEFLEYRLAAMPRTNLPPKAD